MVPPISDFSGQQCARVLQPGVLCSRRPKYAPEKVLRARPGFWRPSIATAVVVYVDDSPAAAASTCTVARRVVANDCCSTTGWACRSLCRCISRTKSSGLFQGANSAADTMVMHHDILRAAQCNSSIAARKQSPSFDSKAGSPSICKACSVAVHASVHDEMYCVWLRFTYEICLLHTTACTTRDLHST